MDCSIAFVSLGSNAPNAVEMLAKAEEALSSLACAGLVTKSHLFYTAPQDFSQQPWFHNRVLKMAAQKDMTAAEFLKALLSIESGLGRKRGFGPRFGPRLIDIDLLLFNNETSAAKDCILPHPRMTNRAFILWPLATLEPDLKIKGHTPAWWLEKLDWKVEGDKIWQPASCADPQGD